MEKIDIKKKLFDEAYTRYSRQIMSYIIRLVRDETQAEDIFQECFLVYLEKVDPERFETSQSFLYSIARNLCFKSLKKSRRTDNHSSEEISDDNRSSAAVDRALEQREILAFLKAQNPIYVDIYLLRVEGRMRLREIQKALGMPSRTLNRRLQELKRLLMSFLKESTGVV